MRVLFLSVLLLGAVTGHAQTTTPVSVPEKAVMQLQKVLKHTQAVVVLTTKPGKGPLPPETRPELNYILVASANEFLAIANGRPTREAYLQSVDAGLSRLGPLMPVMEDRQAVAEYYQDLLDIVGLESSEGRLTAFVEGVGTK
jgi:hypothetical protein